jgi:hypothetical protein
MAVLAARESTLPWSPEAEERVMVNEFIKCEVQDHVALVTMDRPPVNAVNAQFHEELSEPPRHVGAPDRSSEVSRASD